MNENIFNEITAIILTHNEEDNIARSIDAIAWVPHIIVVDSGSTDCTLDIVKNYANAIVIHREFDTFANQVNFALSNVSTEWVLSLDADYILSNELYNEISELSDSNDISGYMAKFVYKIHGKALRSSLYPPRCVLYRRKNATYCDEGHGHRVVIDGRVSNVNAKIFHDDRKPLKRWIDSQIKYAKSEAEYLTNSKRSELTVSDKLRLLLFPMPIIVFFYTFIVRRCIFDGLEGWQYTMQRVAFEVILLIELIDRRLKLRGQVRGE